MPAPCGRNASIQFLRPNRANYSHEHWAGCTQVNFPLLFCVTAFLQTAVCPIGHEAAQPGQFGCKPPAEHSRILVVWANRSPA